MKSIFHVQADTPEDMRKEFVRWLESQQMRHESELQCARTQKDTRAATARMNVMRNAAVFLAEIIIDPLKGAS
jgi:hypothetical protein